MKNKTTYKFEGQLAVVTGGASGIGFSIAKEFLQAGASVEVWDYSADALKKAESELAPFKGQVRFQSVDVSKKESIEKAASALSGPVDILVNNAGITRDKSFVKMTHEEWDAVINTNLTGLFNVTKGLLEKFSASAHKRIVNISSVVGIHGNFGQANYAAAKAGVIGMTKTLSKELGRKGFTVNAIAPGFIQTPMTAAMPADVLAGMAAKVPVQRLGTVEDISNAVLFLSSEGSAYINGTVISVDGGLVL